MKKLLTLAALLTVGLMIAFASNSDATTTYANGTAGTDNNNVAYTPVIGTTTTDTEAAPSGATAGHTLVMNRSTNFTRNVVVTVKANLAINTAGDVGYYDPGDTGAGGPAINTFGASAKLLCWVLDNANGNSVWTRFPAGDQTLAAGDSTATFLVKVADLPKVRRFALVPQASNVPLTITYSER